MLKETKAVSGGATYPFQIMLENKELLERVELIFLWGNYQIKVLRWHLARFTPGSHIPFHKHSEFEFHFIARGKGTVNIFNQHHAFDSGMFYLTGPNIVHEQRASKTLGMDELCLHVEIINVDNENGDVWEIQEAEGCMEVLKDFPLRPLLDHYDAMSCFLEAYSAWHEGKIGAYTTLKQAVIQILIRATKSVDIGSLSLAFPERDIQSHRLQMALHYIHDNYTTNISLQEVANRIGLSSRQLQRIFSKYATASFSSYVEQYRLQKICEDIIYTTDTIEMIAARHGFQNTNYLYQVFKKKYETTPLNYRRKQLII